MAGIHSIAAVKSRLVAAGYTISPVAFFIVGGRPATPAHLFGRGAEADFQTDVDFASPHGFRLIVAVFDTAADAATSKALKKGCRFGTPAQQHACAAAFRVRVVGRVLYDGATFGGAGTIAGREFDRVVRIASGGR